VSGIYKLVGANQQKVPSAKAGDTVALGKLDDARTGDTLTNAKGGMAQLIDLNPPQPVFSLPCARRSGRTKSNVGSDPSSGR
jgi:elongation factor G